jgi:hypothetical protein
LNENVTDDASLGYAMATLKLVSLMVAGVIALDTRIGAATTSTVTVSSIAAVSAALLAAVAVDGAIVWVVVMAHAVLAAISPATTANTSCSVLTEVALAEVLPPAVLPLPPAVL